ncbi:M23 family metallopeptidase [Waterburya agarophytonicola K14]|uniref:M23 family metallopeptidase n=1 Tax=Waterburya agarophytonicola KI4 TaxID=2874699 RepID=A0A964BWC3_9CYAN|nr:M23 family metallopeptidase [Waterburya agarophytonicola]MCC0178775.1 M23 family metallopeptidase [Waterburya agarophytonicola KI4]
MVKSILLGLLVTAIVPTTLAEATVIGNISTISSLQVYPKINLANGCAPLEQETYCLSADRQNNGSLDTYSPLWLTNIADTLLSGSMFQGCRTNSIIRAYSRGASDRISLTKLTNLGCVLTAKRKKELTPFQNKINQKRNNSFPSSIKPKISVETPKKFPKLSRSSLIVAFPKADSTFILKSSKLAHPAPETKRIASPFGWRKRPYSYQLQFHQGIDYGAPLGSPVVAVGDGIVTRVVSGCHDFGNLFCGGQLGNWIEIDHGNGTLGVYGHLKNNSIAIKEGMKVWKNQEIALVGSSGWSTGAHLDFRFKVNGKYEDPAKYVMAIDE